MYIHMYMIFSRSQDPPGSLKNGLLHVFLVGVFTGILWWLEGVGSYYVHFYLHNIVYYLCFFVHCRW